MTSPDQPGDHVEPAPPWSHPGTPVSAPPLHRPSASETTPEVTVPDEAPSRRTPGPSSPDPDEVTRHRPIGPAVVPASRDRRVWFILGLVALLLSCCCTASAITALAWSVGLFDRLAGPVGQSTRVDAAGQPTTRVDAAVDQSIRVDAAVDQSIRTWSAAGSLSPPAAPPGCCWSVGTASRSRS